MKTNLTNSETYLIVNSLCTSALAVLEEIQVETNKNGESTTTEDLWDRYEMYQKLIERFNEGE